MHSTTLQYYINWPEEDYATLTSIVAGRMGLVIGNKKYIREQAFDLLKQFEIEELAFKSSVSLSQGEKQRVAVARAIANNADLILADEPTASLETNQGMLIIELLHNYATKQNKCVIVASHDLRLKDYADRIIYLQDGEMIR